MLLRIVRHETREHLPFAVQLALTVLIESARTLQRRSVGPASVCHGQYWTGGEMHWSPLPPAPPNYACLTAEVRSALRSYGDRKLHIHRPALRLRIVKASSSWSLVAQRAHDVQAALHRSVNPSVSMSFSTSCDCGCEKLLRDRMRHGLPGRAQV